ncbi:MAG: DNA starvation/stationary phase protection protein [Bacteroidota bacterium]|nr:DNA starvation/stationary phase protection protein [Bacteroidota bacterium]MDP4216786.1 DNA starvation/stationary phase protection protein [Bacteroidota bacterium]MDP4245357.1 DNA starvation/stationary phase protection protein [Bacteroidota bacterium]MDP4252634.1 DNA starvation/stationary phase protection protein [Bacteroidota bacterium]MDP4258499.1 DNA starvation/stationary phase protection protein [Bacteroidota bacterium]
MNTIIGLKTPSRAKAAEMLSTVLADEFLLYTKTLNAHWNVEGPDFHSKHLFFEGQYKALSEEIDEIAERIRSLGHYAPATLEQFLKLTHFTEKSNDENTSLGFIASLLSDHDDLIMHLRGMIEELTDKVKDSGTADFLTGIMETHEKMAWMLRAHL